MIMPVNWQNNPLFNRLRSNPYQGPVPQMRNSAFMPGNIPFMGRGGGYPSNAYRGPMPTYGRSRTPFPTFGDFRGIASLMAQESARAAATANNQVGAGFGNMSQAQIAQADAMRQAQQQAGSQSPQISLMPMPKSRPMAAPPAMPMQQMGQGLSSQADALRQAQQQASQQFQQQPQSTFFGPSSGNLGQQMGGQSQGGNQMFPGSTPSYGSPQGQSMFSQPSFGGSFGSGKSGGGKGGGIGDIMTVGAAPQTMNAYAAPMSGFFR